jgi:hypothetical protein
MPTTVLDAYSKAYPFITNRLRASVFLQSDPQAFVASIVEDLPGHPARIWHFPGLPRNNYGFSLDEIDASGNVLANLALFDVVPGQIDGQLVRDDEQIQVGVTTGFNAGLSTVIFDGTGGKPDYVGWEIVPSELTGRGILVRDNLDYTWNSVTGEFKLTQPGDKLQTGTFWNIHFNPIAQAIGNSYPTITDFITTIITGAATIDAAVFGQNLLIEPVSVYTEVTLPNIATVPQGRKLTVEIGGSGIKCVRFLPASGQTINFLRGKLYAYPGESFCIYRIVRSDSSTEWRVSEACGNFRSVGRNIEEDFIQADVINSKLLNGSIESNLQYARIYNEVVLHLPPVQVVSFTDWSTGNNKYLFSLANGTNQFHFPDRRGLFVKNNNIGKAGDYNAESLKISADVKGVKVVPGGRNTIGPDPDALDVANPTGKEFSLLEGFDIAPAGATETQPANYLINKYILI